MSTLCCISIFLSKWIRTLRSIDGSKTANRLFRMQGGSLLLQPVWEFFWTPPLLTALIGRSEVSCWNSSKESQQSACAWNCRWSCASKRFHLYIAKFSSSWILRFWCCSSEPQNPFLHLLMEEKTLQLLAELSLCLALLHGLCLTDEKVVGLHANTWGQRSESVGRWGGVLGWLCILIGARPPLASMQLPHSAPGTLRLFCALRFSCFSAENVKDDALREKISRGPSNSQQLPGNNRKISHFLEAPGGLKLQTSLFPETPTSATSASMGTFSRSS